MNMHPREPLTAKARGAIVEFALYKLHKTKQYTPLTIIQATLQAERMPRHKLYAYLFERGFRYNSYRQTWGKKA